jgi:hypothetical protein
MALTNKFISQSVGKSEAALDAISHHVGRNKESAFEYRTTVIGHASINRGDKTNCSVPAWNPSTHPPVNSHHMIVSYIRL